MQGMTTQTTDYDVIVIGAGPGGMTAALYTSRSNLKTLVLEQGAPGGELLNTAEVENYPGFPMISGPELAQKMYEGSNRFGAEHKYGAVQSVEVKDGIKIVHAGKKSYTAKVVIIATGATHRKLDIPGEEEYQGRGVSYCAVCDGAFFTGKPLTVIGGGDSAVEEGTYLTQHASQVSIVHRRDELRAQQVLVDRAVKNDHVDFIWKHIPVEIKGDENQVTHAVLKDVETGEIFEKETSGVFVYVGLIPVSEPFKGLGITDEDGWIETNELMETAVPGIFAVGDVRKKQLRQIATAVGDGSQAGQSAYNYFQELED
ncbi:thioredoxin-disulfide reductase [Atopobacter phocae]|uniref:thioredoxin-disulfide reductase n=1 Tax=Atopobacter phocae TaxID=136492 RepID=UPI001FE0AF16|nr:thioredoxin-disulfide reductase [Atopobacter phocae]